MRFKSSLFLCALLAVSCGNFVHATDADDDAADDAILAAEDDILNAALDDTFDNAMLGRGCASAAPPRPFASPFAGATASAAPNPALSPRHPATAPVSAAPPRPFASPFAGATASAALNPALSPLHPATAPVSAAPPRPFASPFAGAPVSAPPLCARAVTTPSNPWIQLPAQNPSVVASPLHPASTQPSQPNNIAEAQAEIDKANAALKRTALIADTPRSRTFFDEIPQRGPTTTQTPLTPQHIATPSWLSWHSRHPLSDQYHKTTSYEYDYNDNSRKQYVILPEGDEDSTRLVPQTVGGKPAFYSSPEDLVTRTQMQQYLAAGRLFAETNNTTPLTTDTLPDIMQPIWLEPEDTTEAREPLSLKEQSLLMGDVYQKTDSAVAPAPLHTMPKQDLRDLLNADLINPPLFRRYTIPRRIRDALADPSQTLPRADIESYIKRIPRYDRDNIPPSIRNLVPPMPPLAYNITLKKNATDPTRTPGTFYIANPAALRHAEPATLQTQPGATGLLEAKTTLMRPLENGTMVDASKKGLSFATYPYLLRRLGILGVDVALHGTIHQSFRSRRTEHSIEMILTNADQMRGLLRTPGNEKKITKMLRMVSFNPFKKDNLGTFFKALLASEGVRLAQKTLVGESFTRQTLQAAQDAVFTAASSQNGGRLTGKESLRSYHATGKPIPVEPFIDWAISGRLTGWKPFEMMTSVLVDDTFDVTLPQQLGRKITTSLGAMYRSPWFQLFRRMLTMQLTLRYLDGSYATRLTKALEKNRKQMFELINQYLDGDHQTQIEARKQITAFVTKHSNVTGVSIAGWLTRLVRLRGASRVITDAQSFFAHHIKASLAINALLFLPRLAMGLYSYAKMQTLIINSISGSTR